MNAALYMKKAVTIALRYNLVRRQSNADGTNNNVETQVLDYQHSQRRGSFRFYALFVCISLHERLYAKNVF